MDREKVIKGLEECSGAGNCLDCVYGKEHPALSCKALLEDALELLKEQRKVIECLKEKVEKYELEKSWDENPDRMNGCCW